MEVKFVKTTKKVLVSLITVTLLALTFSAIPAFGHGNAPMNISFQASYGNSAGWVYGPGNSNAEVYLTIGASSAQYGYALVNVHHFPSTLPSEEPSYTAVGYASGTPRILIGFSDGNYIFIFPDSVYGAGTVEYVTSSGPSFVTYTALLTDEASATVSYVIIVADTSQAIPYTAYITDFTYNGIELI